MGDTLMAASSAKGKQITRTVTKRCGYDITYLDQKGKVHLCWITTWRTWGRRAAKEKKAS